MFMLLNLWITFQHAQYRTHRVGVVVVMAKSSIPCVCCSYFNFNLWNKGGWRWQSWWQSSSFIEFIGIVVLLGPFIHYKISIVLFLGKPLQQTCVPIREYRSQCLKNNQVHRMVEEVYWLGRWLQRIMQEGNMNLSCCDCIVAQSEQQPTNNKGRTNHSISVGSDARFPHHVGLEPTTLLVSNFQ